MTERKYALGDAVWLKGSVVGIYGADSDLTTLHGIAVCMPGQIRTEADFKGPYDQTIIDGILAAATDDGMDTIRLAFGNQVAEAIQAKLDATAHAPSAAEIINSHMYFDGMSDNGMLICKGCKEEHTDYAEHIAAKLAAAGLLMEPDET